MVRRFDRNSLIILAAAISSKHGAAIDEDGSVSNFLPWNVAGMAITAICRGTVGGPIPTPRELYEICWNFGNMAEIDEADMEQGMRLVARLLHQQVPFQATPLNEWARAQAIFVDTNFPADRRPEVMTPGWLEDLLGCSLGEYLTVAFLLNTAATFGEGAYGDEMWGDDLAELQQMLPLDEFRRIALQHFVMTIEDAKRARIATQRAIGGPEEFAYNPLISRPFLSDVVPDHWIAPSLQAIQRKASASGLVYVGLEKWGEAFSRDLGFLFQAYVGRNLAEIDGAVVLPEVRYGPPGRTTDSADWVVVLPNHVLIVEVKAAAPTEGMRQSVGELHVTHKTKLEKALKQITRTARAIGVERDVFPDVPQERPVLGVVATFGSFPDMTFALQSFDLTDVDIPFAFLAIEDLETLVALGSSAIEMAIERALESFTNSGYVDLRAALRGAELPTNQIIEAAWNRMPVMSYMTSRGVDFDPNLTADEIVARATAQQK